jgi:hypothetical protein
VPLKMSVTESTPITPSSETVKMPQMNQPHTAPLQFENHKLQGRSSTLVTSPYDVAAAAAAEGEEEAQRAATKETARRGA